MKKVMSNIDEASALSLELKNEVARLKTLLDKFEKNIELLQNGEIWNGANACDVNKSLLGHYDHNKKLLSKLEKCSETLESVSK